MAKAKLAEAQDSLAALEEAVMYVVVAYGMPPVQGMPDKDIHNRAVRGENGKDGKQTLI